MVNPARCDGGGQISASTEFCPQNSLVRRVALKPRLAELCEDEGNKGNWYIMLGNNKIE